MSHTQAAARPGAFPLSSLFNNTRAAVRRVLGRIVVPVESTAEMNDIWRLYRLRPASVPAYAGTPDGLTRPDDATQQR